MNARRVLWLLGALLCLAIVYSILWWGVGEISALWHFPPLFNKVAYTILIVTGIVALINIIMCLFGSGFIVWSLMFVCLFHTGCQQSQTNPDGTRREVNVNVQREGYRGPPPRRLPSVDIHVDSDHHDGHRDDHHDDHHDHDKGEHHG